MFCKLNFRLRSAGLVLSPVFVGLAATVIVADDGAKTSEQSADDQKREIARLIEDLDSPDFETRESAEASLLELGLPAFDALQRATRNSPSPQTQFRANEILAVLKDKSLGYVSLGEQANHMLNQRFGRIEGNTLDSLPRGEQKLEGFRFKIEDNIVLLGSRDLPDKPKGVKGIAVKQPCKRLDFLHAMSFGTSVKEGDLVAKYVVHYADESLAEIPISFGADVRDWWNADDSKPVTRGKVVWTGNNRVAKSAGYSLRLYATSWENPAPEKVVTHIDFVATHEIAAPFCIAITAQRE